MKQGVNHVNVSLEKCHRNLRQNLYLAARKETISLFHSSALQSPTFHFHEYPWVPTAKARREVAHPCPPITHRIGARPPIPIGHYPIPKLPIHMLNCMNSSFIDKYQDWNEPVCKGKGDSLQLCW